MADAIDSLMEKRRKAGAGKTTTPAERPGQFFGMSKEGSGDEHYFEIRLREGLKTCFSYVDLAWFNYDPEAGCLDLAFGEFVVTISGRGLGGDLFDGIKRREVSWVRESDSDLEDNAEMDVYISEILLSPPEGFSDEGEEEGDA